MSLKKALTFYLIRLWSGMAGRVFLVEIFSTNHAHSTLDSVLIFVLSCLGGVFLLEMYILVCQALGVPN